MTVPATTAPTRTLDIEFLFLDLDTCTRCRATDATLLEAIERTRPALEATGVTFQVTKTLVGSETQARALGFVSSPTIRINGTDIAGELVESACDTCSESCACDGGVDCRDWIWRGQRSTQPPVGLIVEAILQHATSPAAAAAAEGPREVPANLRQYFAATASDEAARQTVGAAACCAAEAQASCCPPQDKAACCGTPAAVGSAGCGCEA